MSNVSVEKEKKVYVSLYKKDSLSYTLTLCAIVAELVYVISILDVMPVSYLMGVTVMVNIAILFALFTCAVKMNVYDKIWALVAIVLGIYMIIRQFVLVPVLLQPYDRQLTIAVANLVGAALLMTAGNISKQKSEKRSRLQKKLTDMGEDQNGGA